MAGQALPPTEPAVVVRARFMEPAPHETVHLVHALNEEITQLTGHPRVLQSWNSLKNGHT